MADDKFVYLVVNFETPNGVLEDVLNEYGEQGWQLVDRCSEIMHSERNGRETPHRCYELTFVRKKAVV